MVGTGFIFSFLQISSPTGASISTVATLSTKAEISPEKADRATTAQQAFGTRFRIMSASREGIPVSTNRETSPIVPAIIMITFQFMSGSTSPTGSTPKRTMQTAAPSANQTRHFEKISMPAYIRTKIISAVVIKLIRLPLLHEFGPGMAFNPGTAGILPHIPGKIKA